MRYGRLTTISDAGPKAFLKQKHKRVVCQCDCGNIKEVYLHHLKAGKCKSCGCLKKETIKKNKEKILNSKILTEENCKELKEIRENYGKLNLNIYQISKESRICYRTVRKILKGDISGRLTKFSNVKKLLEFLNSRNFK